MGWTSRWVELTGHELVFFKSQAPPSTELPDWPNSRPQSKDTVRAYGSTTDTERGVEGQLVGIDGDDGIIKLPDGDYKIMDMSNLVKVVDARGFGS